MTEFEDSLTDWFNSIYPVIIELPGVGLYHRNYVQNHAMDLRKMSIIFTNLLKCINLAPPSMQRKEEVNQYAWAVKISIGRLLNNHEYRESKIYHKANKMKGSLLPQPPPCFNKEFFLDLLIGLVEAFLCNFENIKLFQSIATGRIESYQPTATPVNNENMKRIILWEMNRLRKNILSISANWKLFDLYLDMDVMARFLYRSIFDLYDHYMKSFRFYANNQETASEKEQTSVSEIPSFGHTCNVSDREFPKSSAICLMLDLHQNLRNLALSLQTFLKDVKTVTEDEVDNEPVLPLNRYYTNYVQKLKLHELYKEVHGRFVNDIAEHGINLERGDSITADLIIDVKARLFHSLHQINRLLVFNIQKMRDFINKKNANINRRDRVVVKCMPVEEFSLPTCYNILCKQRKVYDDEYMEFRKQFRQLDKHLARHFSSFTNVLYENGDSSKSTESFEKVFKRFLRVLIISIGLTKCSEKI